MRPRDSQRILALRQRLRAMPDAEYLFHLAVYHAAPTVQGIKPATLICPDAKGRVLEAALPETERRLRDDFGVETAALRNRSGALLLLFYHPCLLRSTIAALEVADLLAEAGYDMPAGGLEAVLGALRLKCRAASFPHEIGVLLGYPARDVRRFMTGERCACSRGQCWRAAHESADAARTVSDCYRSAKLRAAKLIVDGADLRELAPGVRKGA